MEKFKNPQALIFSFLLWMVGTLIGIISEDPIKEYAKEINSSPVFINYVVPFIILLIPLGIFIGMLYFLGKNANKEEETKENKIEEQIADKLQEEENAKILFPKLEKLGVINVTDGLKTSKYAPKECMLKVRKHLLFLGILGSKWIAEKEFEDFLNRVEANHGDVKFLLINPSGKAYHRLYQFREGTISTESLKKFYELTKKFECLRVKLYDELPSFRMIFLDNNIMAVSRYKLDKKGYFDSKFGWENPHMIIDAHKEWSFYGSFEDLYHQIWNKSTDLEDYVAQNKKEL